MSPDTARTDRLRWQCRRGMLEIDLLLNNFLDTGYDALSAEQATVFEQVLGYPDAVLLEWLMGRQQPTDGKIVDIVQQIRTAITA